MTGIEREDILAELTCFEKTLNDKVEESLDKALEPVSELSDRTRKLELDMSSHLAGDETDNILSQIKDINRKLEDPEKGVQIVQRELCNTLNSFKSEMHLQLQFNNETHVKLADNQKEMRAEFKSDSEKYEEKLDEFEGKTSGEFKDIKKEISNLRIGGIAAVFFLAILILATNPEGSKEMMKMVASSFDGALNAAISFLFY